MLYFLTFPLLLLFVRAMPFLSASGQVSAASPDQVSGSQCFHSLVLEEIEVKHQSTPKRVSRVRKDLWLKATGHVLSPCVGSGLREG